MGHHGPSHGFANLVSLVSLELTKTHSLDLLTSRWMVTMDTGTHNLLVNEKIAGSCL